jgi:hypothetical protein
MVLILGTSAASVNGWALNFSDQRMSLERESGRRLAATGAWKTYFLNWKPAV